MEVTGSRVGESLATAGEVVGRPHGPHAGQYLVVATCADDVIDGLRAPLSLSTRAA